MARMSFWRDTSGKAEKYFKKVMKRFFPELNSAEFIYSFRNNEKTDDEGKVIIAEARKIPSKEKDLYGFDFEINMHADTWASAREEDKYRIAYHELSHCGIEVDENDEPKRDESGRIVTKMIPHDLYIKSFKSELQLFGISTDIEELAEFMQEMLQGASSSKKKKKFLEELDKAPEKKAKKKKKRLDEDDDDESEEKVKVKKKHVKEAEAELKNFKVSRKTKTSDVSADAKKKKKKKKARLED